MAGVAARVDAGDLHPRIHNPGAQGYEVGVLADAFNHMLDRLTDAFASQRAFIADASHELRTPLTVIRGQLEVLAAQPSPSAAEVRRVERFVQAEIARSAAWSMTCCCWPTPSRRSSCGLSRSTSPLRGRAVGAMSLLARRRFELGRSPGSLGRPGPARAGAAQPLANAIEHTSGSRGSCACAWSPAGGHVRFIVEDDGPGIPADQRERVFDRFHRTDPGATRLGRHGPGLAIVRAIAEAHAGAVAAGSSPEGGASVELDLPGFTPLRRRPPPSLSPHERRAGEDRSMAVSVGCPALIWSRWAPAMAERRLRA